MQRRAALGSSCRKVRLGIRCALRVLEVVELGPMKSCERDVHRALTKGIRPFVEHLKVIGQRLEL